MRDLNIRLLENKEFDREDLKELYKDYDFAGVDPLTCKILVAETNEGVIVGAGVCRPSFHLEPWMIKKEYSNSLLILKMMRKFIKLYENYKGLHLYIFSHRKAIDVATKRVGFKELAGYKILVKEIS